MRSLSNPSRTREHQVRMLAGASVIVLMLASSGVAARSLGNSGGTPNAATAATSAATAASQQAATIAAQAQEALKRAAQSLRALQAIQGAAKAAAGTAATNGVTDGLSVGGLIVDPRAAGNSSLWQNINQPVQTTASGQTTVTLTQTSARAIATWQQFNVGRNTTVYFDQTGGNTSSGNSWIVLNRVDAFGVPSQILGQIKADGTVLVINPNGIIFGAGSQVNVGSLIATTHDIATSTNASVFTASNSNYVQTSVQSGGTTLSFYVPPNEDAANTYFLQNGLFNQQATNNSGNPSTNAGLSAILAVGNQTLGTPGGGSIVVQAGASISTNHTGSGAASDFVALIGPTVTNAGSITSNGQVILAASNAVVLTQPASAAVGVDLAMTVTAATGGNNILGNVSVNSLGDYVVLPVSTLPSLTSGATARPNGALVTNTGLLTVNDGAATLVADSIAQFGGIAVTTSLSRPGSISLNTIGAPTLNGGAVGNIVFGPASVATILPDEASGTIPTSTATSSYFTSYLQPRITATAAGNIDVQGNGVGLGGAFIKAPAALATFTAGAIASQGVVSVGTGGSIALGSGAGIDLSGITGVSLPTSDYLVTLKITANEVADTPLARSLIGSTVTIDTRLKGTRADGVQWVGSPILNAKGYAGLIPQTIDQVLSVGGTLNLAAGQNVVTLAGSSINLSGGYVQYAAGNVQTTRLVGSDGRIYDIGSADPGYSYSLLTGYTVANARWGVTDVYASPFLKTDRYDAGYISGSAGGSATITAATPLLDGAFQASIVAGERQRASLEPMPTGASLNIAMSGGAGTSVVPYTVVLESRSAAPSDPFGLANFQLTSTWAPTLSVRADGSSTLPLLTDVLNAGFGSIKVSTGPSVLTMPAEASLTVLPGGSISLDNVMRLDGSLTARGGSISISGSTVFTSGGNLFTPQNLTIGATARLDASGLWVNDTGATADTMLGRAFVNGGTVSISTASASQVTSVSGVSSGTTTDGVNLGLMSVVTYADATRGIALAPGSVIDVSSGGYVGRTGALSLASDGLPRGAGGNVTLKTYVGGFNPVPTAIVKTPVVLSDGRTLSVGTSFNYVSGDLVTNPPYGPTDGVYRANTSMGGTIFAQGFDGGGTFTLQAPTIQIGGTSAVTIGVSSTAPGASQIALPASFFTDNVFGAYNLIGPAGVTVAADTNLVLRQSNMLVPSGALPASGVAVRTVADRGVLADAIRKPVSLTLTQDGFGNKTSGITVGDRATIVTDPGASVSMLANGAITLNGRIAAGALSNVTLLSTLSGVNILGSIAAPSGSISLDSVGTLTLAAGALLDVHGAFVPNPKVTTYTTGTAYDGGTVTLLGATVEAKPGSTIDVGGTAALVEVPSAGLSATDPATRAIWSNGGKLQIAGTTVYLGSTVRAAGGALPGSGYATAADGGTLSIGSVSLPASLASYAYGPTTTSGILIAQSGDATPATQVTVTADTLNNSGLGSVVLAATTGASSTIGFAGSVDIRLPGSLSLTARSGLINLLPAGAKLANLNDSPSSVGTTVNLSAGYVQLGGPVGAAAGPKAPHLADGILNVTAQWIDLQGNVSLGNVGNASLTSSGPVRLLAANAGDTSLSAASGVLGGSLIAPGRLTVTASEVYPATGTSFLLMSTLSLDASDTSPTLSIQQYANSVPTAPLSAGGTLVLDAQNIQQNGTLWAPLGNIVVGLQSASQLPDAMTRALLNTGASTATPAYPSGAALIATQNVKFGANSLTSVSAAGLTLPYGTTVDGTTWYFGLDGGTSSTGPAQQTAPPAKSIGVFSKNIALAGVLDASGGGDIYAVEFVAGSGGSRNVLIPYQQVVTTTTSGTSVTYQAQYADGRQVYALVPSYSAKLAAYDPVFGTYPYYSGQTVAPGALARSGGSLSSIPLGFTSDTFAGSTGITPGTQVTLTGGNGIAAGTYVLLPGMYATLPGAYRVVQVAANAGDTARSSVGNDGSIYVTGYLGNSLTNSRASQLAMFQLQSGSVWQQSSKINITSGTTYFPSFAATNGLTAPALPVDGGLLVLGASNSLSFLSTNKFAPGTSDLAPSAQGISGQIDIAATNVAIVASDRLASFGTVAANGAFTASSAYSGYLILDADQVSNIGASSVLIGGTALASAPGAVTAVAANLEVATDAAHPLSGPELVLVAQAGSRGLTVDAGSVIQAKGSVAGTSRNITLGSSSVSGDGALLRVSNGTPITITRSNTTGTGQIAIGTAVGTTQLVSGANVVIEGGNSLTVDTSGSGIFAADLVDSGGNVLTRGVSLRGVNNAIAASAFNFGAVPTGAAGLSFTSEQFANLFGGAARVTLRSRTGFNFYDQAGITLGDASNPIGTLTLDGAGLYSLGLNAAGAGNTCTSACATLNATNISLINSQGATGPSAGVVTGAGGTLTLNATGTITADAGAKAIAGFGKINWNAGQSIVFNGTGSLDATAATATPIFKVGSVAVAASGSGYTSVPTVNFAGSNGAGASASAVLGVVAVTVGTAGTGYHTGDPVTAVGPGGSGFTGTAIVNATGGITGVAITSSGLGYTGPITSLSVTSSTGSGAAMTASLGVVGVSLASSGAGYTSIPNVSFSGGGGTGASALALATMTAISVSNGGAGYQSAPSVTITGGGGTGAAAIASLSGTTVNQIALSNGGSGYTSVPTINIWGGPDMTLSAPQLVVNGGAQQSLTTRGNLLIQGAGAAQPDPATTSLGGSLSLTGAAIATTGAPIYAWAGNVKLTAATGDVVLNAGSSIIARGVRNPLMSQYLDAPGGNVQLVSNTGNVTVANGATIDVSNAYTNYAGSVLIQTGNTGTTGVATLNGTLKGSATYNDLGGNFTLLAGSLAGALPLDGTGPNFSGSFSATLAGGDITIAAGRTLTSRNVQLVANGGSVNVDGTIDARGLSGGQISLFGTGTPQTVAGSTAISGGVTIGATARLLASAVSKGDATYGAYSSIDNGATNPSGGTITLGTSGTPTAGATDATYGYELVASANSGWIRAASGAVFDVSGAATAPAGQVTIRAPLLDNHSANVRFAGSVITNGSTAGGGLVLNAYATWSTADGCSLIPGGCGAVTTLAQYNALTTAQQAQLQKHFDGIVDPAGWFDGTGTRVAGSVVAGNTVAYTVASTTTFTSVPTLAFSAGGGSGAAATAIMNVQNGAITTTTTGSGFGASSRTACSGGGGLFTCYTDAQMTQGAVTVAVTGGNGSGLTVSGVTMNANGTVKSITVDNTLGQGYTAPVTLTVSAAGATSATAQAKLIFAGINVTNPGTGYTTAPTLTVSGGGLSSAVTATKTPGIGQRNAFQLPNTVAQGTGIFTPTTAYAPHTAFYQTTLVGFVQNPFAGGDAALIAQDFANPALQSILHLRPEVVLANPASANGGNITVASNWNLGAVQGLKNASAFTAKDGKSVAANTVITDAYGNLLANYANYQGQFVVDKTMPLFYRTAAGEPGVLTLRAAGNVAVNATLSDGFYETSDAFGGTVPVADRIANNPAMSGTIPDFNTTSAANLMSIVPGINNGSFTFNLVGGAAFTGGNSTVNPIAVVPVSATAGASTGNVTINGHTTYPNYDFSGRIIQVPTLVRTGTGNITIAAAGNFQLLDSAAPGAVYTAGAAVSTPDGFTAPTLPANYFVNSGSVSGCTSGTCITGLVNTPTWATGGGSVSVTAGQAIIGIQTPVDTSGGTQTGTAYQPMMQAWTDWYYHLGAGNGTQTPFANCTVSVVCQTAAWINYATFAQGIGALGGGNATLVAGGDITQMGASLPETLLVTGGVTANDARLVTYGGGNLLVQAGGNLNSGNFLVGLGSGRIRVAGAIVADPNTARTVATGKTSSPTGKALDLFLGVQNGFISALAGGSVSLYGVYDPAAEQVLANTLLNVLPGARVVPGSSATAFNNNAFGMSFNSYGAQSGVSMTSVSGDISLVSGSGAISIFSHNAVQAGNNTSLSPATMAATALSGSITTGTFSLVPIPSPTGDATGSIDLLAAQALNLGSITMPDLATGSSSLYVRSVIRGAAFTSTSYISPLGQKLASLVTALHANDSAPAVFAAGGDIKLGAITLIKSADIEAGNNIMSQIKTSYVSGVDLSNIGKTPVIVQNNSASDITSIVAGNSIIGGNYTVYGPGTVLMQAGQNIGPFQQSSTGYVGVMAVGNGSNIGANADIIPKTISYLPAKSADIYVLFGVKPQVNYAATIAQYVDPARAGTSGIDLLAPIALMLGDGTDRAAAWADFNRLSSAQQKSLVDRALATYFGASPYANYMAAVTGYVAPGAPDVGYDFLGNIAGTLGISEAAAGSLFTAIAAGQQSLTLRQKLAIDRAFLDFMIQVGKDRNDPNSAYAGQYARAYAAISTLFPAALGYTDNGAATGSNGAATRVATGTLTLSGSVLETQLGSDINILSPGGSIIVGSNRRDVLLPNQEGILTLAGGSIRSFTDGSVQLGQSRIMTTQGGDIDLFTANGDLIAGEGPKTYSAISPLHANCDANGYCPINPSGLVTGAGIAALLTLPGQDPADSNANLFAPRGTIDAGAAGIRVAGTLNIAALQIVNAFNIQVQGVSVGMPVVAAPPVAALSNSNTVAAAGQQSAAPSQGPGDRASVIIVEVLGYGGDTGDDARPETRRERRSRLDDYNPNSAVRMLGNGNLSEEQARLLTAEERSRLNALSAPNAAP